MKLDFRNRLNGRQEPLHGYPLRGAGRPGVLEQKAANLVLARVSDDPSNPRQRCQLLRAALRVAAGDENLRSRVPPVNSADGLPQLGIGGSRNGAAIEDDHVGLPLILGRLKAALDEFLRDGSRIGLIGTASEMDRVKSRHHFIL